MKGKFIYLFILRLIKKKKQKLIHFTEVRQIDFE